MAPRTLATLWAIAAATQSAVAIIGGADSHHFGMGKSKSVVMGISDGFGPASETFARGFYQTKHNLPWTHELPIDKMMVGTIRTRSADSLVTDSAAGATAYSCGVKTKNDYIGMDADDKPCGTILEAAKAMGYATGLVVTTRITHATPGSFSAHNIDRDEEADIAFQQLGNYALGGPQVDILLGGGGCFFVPNTSETSCRDDEWDGFEEAKAKGFNVLRDRAGFDALNKGVNASLPIFGSFSLGHMAYEVDRDGSIEPSLTEMSTTALNALKASGKPFFIMIEGSRIDHAGKFLPSGRVSSLTTPIFSAGHNNDPVAHLWDILAYNEAMEAVAKWIDANDDAESETVLISTSDHETGGLTLAYEASSLFNKSYLPEYNWFPQVLLNVTVSAEKLGEEFSKSNETDKEAYFRSEIISKLAIHDISEVEITALMNPDLDKSGYIYLIGDFLNIRAHISWTTRGHSGGDVGLYAYGNSPSLSTLKGNLENSAFAGWAASYLGLRDKMDEITGMLNNQTGYTWYGTHPDLVPYTTGLPASKPKKDATLAKRHWEEL